MTPNQDSPSDQDIVTQQVEQLIRLVRTGEETNIEMAFLLAEGLGNPTAFQMYIQSLLPLYELAFENTPDHLDKVALLELFQLTELVIPGRELTELPENIGELVNLQRLYCADNHLQTLPESIGALHNLQRLDCSYNQLQDLPESLGQLRNMLVLYCDSNQLQTLPESLARLPKLQWLNAGQNPITHIPEALREKEGLELRLD